MRAIVAQTMQPLRRRTRHHARCGHVSGVDRSRAALGDSPQPGLLDTAIYVGCAFGPGLEPAQVTVAIVRNGKVMSTGRALQKLKITPGQRFVLPLGRPARS